MTMLAVPSSITRSGRQQKRRYILSSRGLDLPIPEHADGEPHFVLHQVHPSLPSLKIVTDASIDKVPLADGDKAMQYILDELHIGQKCQEQQQDGAKQLLVVDVGGLFGDFGLSSAVRDCQTVIFEPQLHHAQQIAASIVLNNLQNMASVHRAAVSPLDGVTIATGTEGTVSVVSTGSAAVASSTETIPTEQLDNEFRDATIVFLKVDVEGNEDQVWETATGLFRNHQILNAVFEYTPAQFEGRGTDYETFLPRLYKTGGATACYALHRKRRKIFFIPRESSQLFFETMKERRMQTDIYCNFEQQGQEVRDVFRGSAPEWSPKIRLTK